MLDLADISFFSQLPPKGLGMLRRLTELRSYPVGSVICRQGDAGSTFFAIAAGGVAVHPGTADPEVGIFLGPGQVFGEMSILSGAPVSATVIAARDTHVFAVSEERFLKLLETQPALHNALIQILIDRVRHRSSLRSRSRRPACALMVLPESAQDTESFRLALVAGIEHYAAGSCLVDTVSDHGWSESVSDQRPEFFPASDRPFWKADGNAGRRSYATRESDAWLGQLICNWRASASLGQILVCPVTASRAGNLKASLEDGDTVLICEKALPVTQGLRTSAGSFGLASVAWARVGNRMGLSVEDRLGPWSFFVPTEELQRVMGRQPNAQWNRDLAPHLDWVARWTTGREAGIALGAGGTCGLAHLGVLQVLEEAGVTVDYLCGTSMGGAVALIYAKTASAAESIEMARDLAGSNETVVDVTWLPRSGLLAGGKARRVALGLWGDVAFAEFAKPAAAIVADLVAGDRFVFERGSAAIAARATTAIPGIFPPIFHEGRILVDGALINRIPLDLLDRRRCGLKMAVNVIPSPAERGAAAAVRRRQMKDRFGRLLGLRHVLASSWELLGWWHGAVEAQHADVILEPRTDTASGHDFGAIDEMIEAGRKAARDKLPLIGRLLESLLKPGVP
jgi:NTE family protein